MKYENMRTKALGLTTIAFMISAEILAAGSCFAAAGGQSGILSEEELFTKRDLLQTADTGDAEYYQAEDAEQVTLTREGVYVFQGKAEDFTIIVEAGDSDKVQLVLDDLRVVNRDFPVIYVKSADKVFVTTTDTENVFSVTGSFRPDGDTNTDAAIFSRDDLLNGTGSLSITSQENGVTSKDDLKITGGTYLISAGHHALEANDSISVYDGDFTLKAGTDGLHSGKSDGSTPGEIYIADGTFSITASSDGIQGSSLVQIDGGSMDIAASEGIESTYVQINSGIISIQASDDGINAAQKSTLYSPTVEINDGDITIVMGAGDTDAVDSNGSIYVNGGKIDITGNSSFDFDREGQINGGTVIVNGQEIQSMQNSMSGRGQGKGMWGGYAGQQENQTEGWAGFGRGGKRG